MKELAQWIDNKIRYKEDLNDKYRDLADGAPGLYSGRILFGSGYIQALQDVLEFINKDNPDELSPD